MVDLKRFDSYIDSQPLFFYEQGEKATRSVVKEGEKVFAPSNINELTLESGSLFSQGEFFGGMGQVHADRRSSDPSRYLWLRGFDVVDGTLKHHRAWLTSNDSVGLTDFAVANGILFGMVAGSSTLYNTSNLTSWNTEALDASATANCLTSAGVDLYIGTSTGVRKRDSAGTFTDESLLAGGVSAIHFAKGRLIWYGSTGRTINEEPPGSVPATIDTLPSGWTARRIFDSGSYIYVILTSGGGRSEIWHYGLNAAASALERKGFTAFPEGVFLYTGCSFTGVSQVFVGGYIEDVDGTRKPVFFKCTPTEDGSLNWELVAEGKNGITSTTPEASVRTMVSSGRGVYMNWPTGTADAYNGQKRGVAYYDLITRAFSLLPTYSSTLASESVGIARYKGRTVIGSSALNDTYATDTDDYEATATYISSIGDGNAPGIFKLYDKFNLRTKPIPAGVDSSPDDPGSVAVYFTTKHPEEDDWTLLTTLETAGATGTTVSFPSGTVSRSLAIKLVSSATGTQAEAPEIEGWDVSFYPADESPDEAEVELVRSVLIAPNWRKDEKQNPFGQNPSVTNEYIWDRLNKQVTWTENFGTYDVRLVEIVEVSPENRIVHKTQGDVTRESVILQLRMRGTRQ